MFPAGLKFALGLMTGMFTVFGFILGSMAVVRWAIEWRKNRGRSKRIIRVPARTATAHRNILLLTVWYPAWVDEPTEPVHRKSEFKQ
jgi:hypothetical protein